MKRLKIKYLKVCGTCTPQSIKGFDSDYIFSPELYVETAYGVGAGYWGEDWDDLCIMDQGYAVYLGLANLDC